jgi:ribosomal protein S18 acetylase RimI-like enzyme
MSEVRVEALVGAYREWALRSVRSAFGSTVMVSRGNLWDVAEMEGFVAFIDGVPVGLLTYHVDRASCEVTSLHSEIPGRGAGAALIEAVRAHAAVIDCTRLWLITTNDNTPALRFYQKQGFEIAAVHRRALDYSRRLKPEIPERGLDAIPIRDEIELEILLRG